MLNCHHCQKEIDPEWPWIVLSRTASTPEFSFHETCYAHLYPRNELELLANEEEWPDTGDLFSQ